MPTLSGFRTYEEVLAANGERTVHTTGRYVAFLEQSGAFAVALDDGAFSEFEAGLTALLPGDERFKTVRLRDLSGAQNTVKFNTGFGDIRDARLVVPSGLDVSVSTDLENIADVAVGAGLTVQLAAANLSRRELIVTSPNTAVGEVRIGRTGGVGAASGILLQPGGAVVLATSARVDCHNPQVSAITLALLGVVN